MEMKKTQGLQRMILSKDNIKHLPTLNISVFRPLSQHVSY